MSPEPVVLNPLPPEAFGSKVALRWKPVVDDWNRDAWNQPLYASVPIPAELSKPGQIVGDKINYATGATFSTPKEIHRAGLPEGGRHNARPQTGSRFLCL